MEEIETVRSSRDGHEFHERWAARRSLELLYPEDNLVAISVEGLASNQKERGTVALEEIADLSLYYGATQDVDCCELVEILQFKYSNSSKDEPATASYLKKTLKKFARDLKSRQEREGKVQSLALIFITNRPFSSDLLEAIESIKQDRKACGASASRQRKSLIKYCDDEGVPVQSVIGLLTLQSTGGDLTAQNQTLKKRIVDWSSGNDYQARARLYELTQLLRDKAGGKGQKNNLITKEDVLGALGVDEPEDLLPAKAHFVDIGPVLPRTESGKFIELVRKSSHPIVLHADGGVGKTVFLQSISNQLRDQYEVIVFDCFGGGSYRQLGDGRHLPGVGLLHIVNTIATRGLCDPLLPGDADTRLLIQKTRKRLKQAVSAIREQSQRSGLLLILDAFDNSVEEANDRKELAFPPLLFESLSQESIEGFKLVGSARSHRRKKGLRNVTVADFSLPAFDRVETKNFLDARLDSLSDGQVSWAFQRSGGNGRVLEYLVNTWSIHNTNELISKRLDVVELIAAQVRATENQLRTRGWGDVEVSAFFAALSLLPPPVPLDQFAIALGWDESAIRSAVSDLAPMLERVPQGVIFRDEPTETFIRDTYKNNQEACGFVANQLMTASKKSSYAGEALPKFLEATNDLTTAYDLALSNEFPSEISSDFGRHRLRIARLSAALKLATRGHDSDRLVRILAELARVQAANNRGDDYIRVRPELAVSLGGQEAVRRLFHDRSGWSGSRHGRLAIAFCFQDELDEADIQAERLRGWINWYFRQDREVRRETNEYPTSEEFAALLFHRALQGKIKNIDKLLGGFQPRFALQVADRIVELLVLHQAIRNSSTCKTLEAFLVSNDFKSVAFLLSLAANPRLLSDRGLRVALKKISQSPCEKVDADKQDYQSDRLFEKSVLSCSLRALMRGMKGHANSILRRCELPRLASHDLISEHWIGRGFSPVLAVCLNSWANGRTVEYRDLLPYEVSKKRNSRNAVDRKSAIVFLGALEPGKQPEHLRGRRREKHKLYDERECKAICDAVDMILAYTGLIEPWVLRGRRPLPQEFTEIVEHWKSVGPRSRHQYDRNPKAEMQRQLGFNLICLLIPEVNDLSENNTKDLFAAANHVGIGPSQSTQLIDVLSASGGYWEATAAQGISTAKEISKDEYVDNRGAGFLGMSSASVGGSVVEARSHYQFGLSQLDRMGAGDFDFVYSLLELCSVQKGGFLEGPLAQRLMNMCHVLFAEEPHKFGWTSFGRAMANSVGRDSITKLVRWHDQNVAEFSYGAPQLISFLVEAKQLSATRAIALLWLTSNEGGHNWSIGDGLISILKELPDAQRPAAAQSVLSRVKADRAGTGWPELWNKLLAVEKEFNGCFSVAQVKELHKLKKSSSDQRDEINARQNHHGDGDTENEWRAERLKCEAEAKIAFEVLVVSCSVRAVEEIDQHLTAVNEIQKFPGHSGRLFLEALMAKCSVSDRPGFIAALPELGSTDFGCLLDVISGCSEKWKSTSAFVPSAVSNAISELIKNRGSELFETSHGVGRRLAVMKLLSTDFEQTIYQLLDVVAWERIGLGSEDWFLLANQMCEFANGTASLQALESILASPTVELGDEIGEGAFQPRWHAPQTETDLLASIVWHQLGSSDSFTRWKAARMPTVLAEMGLIDELRALVDHIGSPSHSSLTLQDENFALDQSKQWLLIGLARAAYFFPIELRAVRKQLVNLLANLNGHAIHLTLAARALDNMERKRSCDPIIPKHFNSLPFGKKGEIARKRQFGRLGQPFEFGFDDHFERYDLDDLEELFGITIEQSAIAVKDKIKSHWPDAVDMDYFGGHDRYGDGDEKFEANRDQIARHALLHAASELAIKKKVTESDYYSEQGTAWASWLKRYDLTFDNGLWLADYKDPEPEAKQIYLLNRDKRPDEIIDDFEVIKQRLGLEGSFSPKSFPLYSYWDSADGVHVRLTTMLAPKIGSIGISEETRKKDTHRVWFPGLEDDGSIDPHRDRELDKRLVPWIWTKEHLHIGIDQYDEFAAKEVAWRPRLGPKVQKNAALYSVDEEGTRYFDNNGRLATQSIVWGQWQGHGREMSTEGGAILLADAQWLNRFLKNSKQVLLMSAVLTKYNSGSYGEGSRSLRQHWIVRRDEAGHLRNWRCIQRVKDRYSI